MRDKIVVTIEPTKPRERLDISEAFEQVLDFLRLLELASDDNADFQWELEKASTNSPFTVVAVKPSRPVQAGRIESLPIVQAKVQNGLSELAAGSVPPWMRKKQRTTARRIAVRYRERIGRVALRTDEASPRQFLFNSAMAAKALVTLEKVDGIEDVFVPAHRSYGEIEGRLLQVGQHRSHPAFWMNTVGYEVVRCLVDQKRLEGIGGAASMLAIWQHKRVRVVGALWFKEGGTLEQVSVDDLELFPSREPDLASIADPDFTAGMPVSEYLDGLNEGEHIRKVYWDSCTFLGLINTEAEKHRDSKAVWEQARSGQTQIITSFFTLAEVFKAKCEGKARPLAEDEEDKIAQFFEADLILQVPVDRRTATLARKLMRRHEECKKPTDAIHLATAILMNVDEMHTYDGADLLPLSKAIARQDGEMLTICPPYVTEPELDLPHGGPKDDGTDKPA